MFDRIIEQAAGRFGLGPDQARQLLGALIGLVFDHRCGGAASFMQRLQGQGLGDVAKSWLGQGARQPIIPAQLESALGAGAIGGIASRLGLPESAVSVAAASMLPDALGELSENGALPTGIPQGLRQWMGGLGELVGDISHWGAGAVGASGAGIGGVGDAVGQAGRRAGAGLHRAADAVGDARAAAGATSRWIPWLLIAAVVPPPCCSRADASGKTPRPARKPRHRRQLRPRPPLPANAPNRACP
jgi:uncharacterized protein YidB (DUF937 family)